MAFISCSECGKQVSILAELCPECGYPANRLDHARDRVQNVSTEDEDPASDHAALREYRLMQVIGAGVALVGVAAVIADSPIAAMMAIASGIGTFAVGLLGAWRGSIGR